MQIIRSSIDTTRGPTDSFTGDVYIDAVAAAPSPSRVSANLVHRHGDATNRLMVHVAINEGDDEHAVVHSLEPVTDEKDAATPVNGS